MKKAFIFLILMSLNNVFCMQNVLSKHDFLDNLEFVKEEKLEELAEVESGGYGYKSSNLTLMKNVLEELSKHIEKNLSNVVGNYSAQIPEFLPVGSKDIKDFFSQQGVNLDEEWKKVIKDKSLEDIQKNPDEFVKASEEIAKKIHEIKSSPNGKEKFKESDLWEKIKNFYVKTQEQHQEFERFMVRSTAGEDRPDLANAGGNKSIANVTPKMETTFNAICEVIASYFEEKSIKQRIAAGDIALIDQERLLTPVLIQAMVGEYKIEINYDKASRKNKEKKLQT